ncbi:hypothetical protein PVAND_009709 [Polypedilum vanderplanki]|uniref:BZIP domain-containing protein n=1 Tax=Polypedilum vanderplanki TaxID=319348 RepID=A0A9J6CED5_POLVA|nr:hypothetical protein PVAND_009709 [Polypedilum vanderplanki]
MIFGDKISIDSEKTKRINENTTQPPQIDPFSFSALHFIRNRLIPTDISQCYNIPTPSTFPTQPLPPLETILPLAKISMQSKLSSESEYQSESPVITTKQLSISPPAMKSPILLNNSSSLFCNSFLRRPRGEKRPIPEEQKDEKYFERRKRNNEAAKKSRDARKLREDRIALRAALLEQENSILRAQTLALREEVCTLRQILCNRAIATSNLTSAVTSSA